MDVTSHHHQAVTLVGTVALPSPYPAVGRASFVLTDWDGETVIYVKLVQVISPKRIITRFVRPGDIRAIRSKPKDSKVGPEAWPLISPAKTRAEIAAGEKAIIAHAKAAGVTYLEEPWHAEVILYVPEPAPVLHRTEVGVTAAVSAESPSPMENLVPSSIPCCT
jgi:hypothetical protein